MARYPEEHCPTSGELQPCSQHCQISVKLNCKLDASHPCPHVQNPAWRWPAQQAQHLRGVRRPLSSRLCSFKYSSFDFTTCRSPSPLSDPVLNFNPRGCLDPRRHLTGFVLVCALRLAAGVVDPGRREDRCLGHSGGSLDAVKLNPF